MGKVRNVLFIMSDQLRWDYLSCYGHPSLETPHMDRLAQMGVRFDRAYVQSPVCGPSRMSFYTGRTAFSHGSTWNNMPLPIGEMTLGDYLRPDGVRVGLAGKTHMRPDAAGMERLGLTRETEIGLLVAEGGFEPFERDDGLHPNQITPPEYSYNVWLRSKGYDSDNPWNDFANAAEGPNGEILSGWSLRNSNLPARVKEEHSETPYITDRGLDFIRETGEDPWLLHLSYIKPHWPYMAPAPYHDMYGPNAFLPVVRDERERADPHPVYAAFMNLPASEVFSRDEVRDTVMPPYMGLIKQIDDHLGRLFAELEAMGRMDDTMIVLTSDHGDYLGDHWLGEKELFHEPSVRIPLIVYDPDPAADATRGSVETRFVEAIDLVPTFIDAMGTEMPTHRLEGRSLLPLLRGEDPAGWRDDVFSELDYAFYRARLELGLGPADARCYMIRTERWKYVHYVGYPPQLFDLENDPDEYVDLGLSGEHAAVRAEMHERLFERLVRRKNRIAMTDARVEELTDTEREVGIIIGEW